MTIVWWWFYDAHDKNDDDVHDDNTDDELTCEQHVFCKLSCEQCVYDGFELTCEHKYFCEVLVIAVAYLVEIQIPHEANAYQIANFQIFRLWELWHHGQFFVKLMFKDDNDCLVS